MKWLGGGGGEGGVGVRGGGVRVRVTIGGRRGSVAESTRELNIETLEMCEVT